MHNDESLTTSRPSTRGTPPDIKLPTPTWAAKGAATPGGVPPMFASGAQAQPSGTRADPLEG